MAFCKQVIACLYTQQPFIYPTSLSLDVLPGTRALDWKDKQFRRVITYHTFLDTGIAYPILSRWGWNKSGWLKAMGYRDFSGSGIIHVYAGACGFVAAWIVGPRTNRYHPTRQDDSMPPHSMPVMITCPNEKS